MIAILSDIHANLEALQAVMDDVMSHGASDHIVCLGDIVGYGPDPGPCLDAAAQFRIALQGNHEKALLVSLEGVNFNEVARGSIEWTRGQLDMRTPQSREANAHRWDFMDALDEIHRDEGRMFVHGTPRYPTIEYLYERDIHSPAKLQAIFDLVDHVCFTGHTHMPGIWTEDRVFISPVEANYEYRVTAKKTIINVGSVGQPRDGDTRACYVLLDGDHIRFRRVAYPAERTAEKIRAVQELHPVLARRLLVAK